MAKFLQTERGGRKLVYNGFGYVKKRELGGKITWNCDMKDSASCRAYAKTDAKMVDESVVEEFGQHSHQGNPSKFEIISVKNALKRKATESVASTTTVVDEVVGGVSLLAAPNLGRVESMKRRVRAYRSTNFAPTPKNVAELVIPDQFKKTLDGDSFLLADDSYGDGQRMVLFGAKKYIDLLKSGTLVVWMCDGTFSVAPTIFTQLYTVHALVGGETFPVIYGLLTEKSKEAYSRLFGRIWESVRDDEVFPPDVIVTDFEQAAMSAIDEVFTLNGIPTTTTHGCFFHLCQNIQRHVQSSGYKNLYESDKAFVMYVKMVAALSFVQVNLVPHYYLKLEAKLKSIQASDQSYQAALAALEILHYFGRTYVGMDQNGRRVTSMFPAQSWNNVYVTNACAPRTNNMVEGWHHRFQSKISCDHPSVWKLLQAIQEEQQYTERYYEMVCSGKGKRRSEKYAQVEVRLNQAMSLFGDIPEVDYLRGIAHNF